MNDHLHEGIDLENTKIVWTCEDCGEVFEDENKDADCPECGSSFCTHEHVPNNVENSVKCGKCGSTKFQKSPSKDIDDETGEEIILPDLVDVKCLDCGFEFLIANI